MRNTLKEEGIEPGPNRKNDCWDKLIRRPAETLWAVGFFAVKSSTLKGIRDLYLMVFRGNVSLSRKAGPLDASSENQRQDETESMSDQNGRHLFRSLSRQCYF